MLNTCKRILSSHKNTLLFSETRIEPECNRLREPYSAPQKGKCLCHLYEEAKVGLKEAENILVIIRIWDGHWEQRDGEMIARGSRYWKAIWKWNGKRTVSGSKWTVTL